MVLRFALPALALMLASCTASPPPAPSSPSPFTKVVGPVAQNEASHAFGGAAYTLKPEDLAKEGYVEEEFFVSGKADVYDWPASGAVVKTPDAPYTTRVLVRRPSDVKKFSGIVAAEPMHSSGNSWMFHFTHMYVMSQGDMSILVRPIPSVLLGLAALLLVIPLFKKFNAVRVQVLDREA